MYGISYVNEQSESKSAAPKEDDLNRGGGHGHSASSNAPGSSAPAPAPPSTPRPTLPAAASMGPPTQGTPTGELRGHVRTPSSSNSGPSSATSAPTQETASSGLPSGHSATPQTGTGSSATNPNFNTTTSSHSTNPMAYYSISGIAHARSSPLATRTRSPLSGPANRAGSSLSPSPAPFTPTSGAPQPPASPAQPGSSTSHTPTPSAATTMPGPLLRHGALSLPLPTPTPHGSHSSQAQSLPLMSLGAFGASSTSAAGGAQASPSPAPGSGHGVSSGTAAATGAFTPSQPGSHGTPSGPPTPTAGSNLHHRPHEQQTHSQAPNGLYLPNIWMGDSDWRQHQQPNASNSNLFAFPSLAGRHDTGASGSGGSRARWKERDAPAPGVNGFMGGTTGATSPSHMNGPNVFNQVNGINGSMQPPISHTATPHPPHPSAEASPSPAHNIFTSPTVNGGDNKEHSSFAYGYDRYRNERRNSREISPLTRDTFRGDSGPAASSSSIDHQAQPTDPSHSYNHFGTAPHHSQPGRHQAQAPTTYHLSGTSPFSFNSAAVNPGVDGYVPVGMRPVPPRLTPGLPQGHAAHYGDVNSSYPHPAYGHTSHTHGHQNHQSYTSWPSIYSNSSPFFVPEMADGVTNMAGSASMGGVGNLSAGMYSAPDDLRHNWTPTPPPLGGAAVAGPSTGGDMDANQGRQPRRAVSAPSVPKPKPQRRFPCPDCSEAFTRRNDLVRHRRKHTGEKPFSCPVCHQAFARKDKLLMHVQRAEQCTARAPPRAPRGRARRDASANSTN